MDKQITSVGGFSSNLSKAFDTIDHFIRLMKLSHYGIRGVGLNSISNYLSNRVNKSQLSKNIDSKPMNILRGVSQGSILGSVLFILYVNDIYYIVKNCSIILIADDSNIFFMGHDLCGS